MSEIFTAKITFCFRPVGNQVPDNKVNRGAITTVPNVRPELFVKPACSMGEHCINLACIRGQIGLSHHAVTIIA
jgi:hypothetical protein